MTNRRANGTNKCLEIIEDYSNRQWEFGQLDFRENIDDCSLKNVWKNPERLENKSDYDLLYFSLAREISAENYEEPLAICRKLCSSEEAATIFSNLLMLIFKLERRKRIDPHLILCWLETGDQMYNQKLSKKFYAIMKLYFLSKIWKTKIDCFSCGCVQRITIELFLENNSQRLNEALHLLIKSNFSDIPPTVLRCLNSFSDVRTVDLFCFYIEILQELQQCQAIPELTGDSASIRLIQLVGLLCEMKSEDVPEACNRLNKLIGYIFPNGQKKASTAIETLMRSKLLPKVFTFLSEGSGLKLDNPLYEKRFSDLIESSNPLLAQESAVLFAPLQLLIFVFKSWEISKKSESIVKKQIDSLNLSNSQGHLTILYVISLIYRTYPSLFPHLVEFLESQFSKESAAVKKSILIVVGILERLAQSNETMSTYFQQNSLKSRLILSTSLDCPESAELVFQYLSALKPSEFSEFLSLHCESLSSSSWSLLFREMSAFNFYVNSDVVWSCALKKSSEADVIAFIENQLRLLTLKNDRISLKIRVEQIFKHLKTNSPTTKTPHRELLLSFSNILLTMSSDKYQLLPSNTTYLLVPLLVLAYCFFYDRHETAVMKLLRAMSERIKEKENLPSTSTNDPLEFIEEICDSLQNKTDLFFLEKETFVQVLFDYSIESPRGNNTPNIEASIRTKERIAVVASILFGRLAFQLQKFGGDKGKSSFCLLANIIEKQIAANPSTSSVSKKMCHRALEGYGKMTKQWNSLFSCSKVMKLLAFAKNHPDLLARAMDAIRGNEILLLALRTTKKKEFEQFEQL